MTIMRCDAKCRHNAVNLEVIWNQGWIYLNDSVFLIVIKIAWANPRIYG
jgi:hypothetical protein